MRLGILISIATIMVGNACTGKKSSVANDIQQADTVQISPTFTKIDFDFLSACDSLEMWLGGIQGVNQSDSTGPYIFGECHTNRHYDVIVFHRSTIPLDVGADYENNRIADNVYAAEYYAFEIPKRKPRQVLEDNARFDYVFPCEVRICKRIKGEWYQIDKRPIESFEELGRLKLNVLFGK